MKQIVFLLLLLPATLAAQQPDRDPAGLGRYAQANVELTKNPAVVFMGNSLTDGWDDTHAAFFTDNNYACRGISGQVSAQMLSRFHADVLALHPQAVVILAGTNDIAQNSGYASIEQVVENIASMAKLAAAAGIRPILCSVLPVGSFSWRPEVKDVPQKIRELNTQLRNYAKKHGFTWVEYYEPLAADDGSMRAEYTSDGVHLNAAGYAVMERVITPVLVQYAQ